MLNSVNANFNSVNRAAFGSVNDDLLKAKTKNAAELTLLDAQRQLSVDNFTSISDRDKFIVEQNEIFDRKQEIQGR